MDSKRLHPFNYTNVSHLEWCNMSPARNLTNKLFIYCISWGERFIIQFSTLVERAISGDKWRVSGVRTVLHQIESVQNLLPSLLDLRCPFGCISPPSHSALLYLFAVGFLSPSRRRGLCRATFVLFCFCCSWVIHERLFRVMMKYWTVSEFKRNQLTPFRKSSALMIKWTLT